MIDDIIYDSLGRINNFTLRCVYNSTLDCYTTIYTAIPSAVITFQENEFVLVIGSGCYNLCYNIKRV